MDITSPLWLGVSQTIRRLPTPTTPAGDPKSKPINQPRFPRGDPANSPGPASPGRLANRRRNPDKRAIPARHNPAHKHRRQQVPNQMHRPQLLLPQHLPEPELHRAPPDTPAATSSDTPSSYPVHKQTRAPKGSASTDVPPTFHIPTDATHAVAMGGAQLEQKEISLPRSRLNGGQKSTARRQISFSVLYTSDPIVKM